ncbi:hypothetical protein SprV_0301260500 [Sparganum proliferum]
MYFSPCSHPHPNTTLTQSLSEKISSTVDSSCSLAVSVSSDPDVPSLPRSNSSAITIVTPATESSSSSSKREGMRRADRIAAASDISNASSLSFSSISGLSPSSSSNSSSRRTLDVTTNVTVVSDGDDGDEEEEEEEKEEEEGRYSRASSPTRCPHHLRHIPSLHLDVPRKQVPQRRSTMAHQQTCSLHCHLPSRPLGVLMVFRRRQQHTRRSDDTSQDISSSIYDRPWPSRPTREVAVQATPSVEDSLGQSHVDASDGDVSSDYCRYLSESGVSQASQCEDVVTAAGDNSGREGGKITLKKCLLLVKSLLVYKLISH